MARQGLARPQLRQEMSPGAELAEPRPAPGRARALLNSAYARFRRRKTKPH